MEEWFVAGAADGFNILPPYFPGAFADFVDLVVPELQRRGLFRHDYQGTTLRDHFGLAPRARPAGGAPGAAGCGPGAGTHVTVDGEALPHGRMTVDGRICC